MLKRTILCAALMLASASNAFAQATVFVVRHAERADSGGAMADDPDLSAAGRARAESLANVLKDAGVVVIFATEFKRTQQTAAPLAKAMGLSVTTAPTDTAALVAIVKATVGNVLVVGHSNTVPELIKALGVTTPVTVGDTEFDNLFIVRTGDKPSVIRLHYR
jgi:broad specificity phosphatase PhoE